MTRAPAPPFFRRLHVRIGAIVLTVFALMALGLLLTSRAQQERLNLEVTQRLNLGLARYIVEHQPGPLLDANGEPDHDLVGAMAMHVMRVNPAVEVYLLDATGRIVAHVLDAASVPGTRVDLAPVLALLRGGDLVRLPVLGDDPRAPGQLNIFSAAAIFGPATTEMPLGYLYVILQGQAAQGLIDGTARSEATRATTLAIIVACALAGGALLASLGALTRPLRRLTRQVQAFRSESLDEPPLADAADEIGILDAAVRDMQRRIGEQFAQMEESDRMRRELMSNLSHDLNTPLTSIQGYAELCLLDNERLSAAERAQHLRLLLRHCTSLSKRVADLFELSKLDAGRAQPKLEVFCLAELLQDVIQGYQLEAQARCLSLSLQSADTAAACVRADIALLERVFQNLIDNALRHTPPGGSVEVVVAPSGDTLRVSVVDNGVGIAHENLAHIFERYHRVRGAAEVTDGPSAGLGLAIVKRILELHGSVIHVSSAVAQGTRFDFSLQRAG